MGYADPQASEGGRFRRVVSSTTGGCALAVVFSVGMFGFGSALPARAEGTVCATEVYNWLGNASLAAGESFDTGVIVPVVDGTSLTVNAYDYSTDIVGAPLSVSVGPSPAAGGTAIEGGSISATNPGVESLLVTSIAVSIDRCHQVDQAVAVGGPAEATEPAVGGAVSAQVPPNVNTVPAVPAEGLPATGATSGWLVLAASLATAAGGALTLISRRRPVTVPAT